MYDPHFSDQNKAHYGAFILTNTKRSNAASKDDHTFNIIRCPPRLQQQQAENQDILLCKEMCYPLF